MEKSVKLLECSAKFSGVADKPNMVEGYASVFGNVDSYGDIVVAGAFAKTIKERVPRGLVPFVADHRWEIDSLLGTVVAAEEDSHGLHFTAEMSSVPSVQEVRTKMLEGHVRQMSFSFRTIAERFPEKPTFVGGLQVSRYLTEVALLDIAPVVVAANDRAEITRVKQFVTFNEFMKMAAPGELRNIADLFWRTAEEREESKLWEQSDTEVMWRLRDPALFKEDSFRSKDLGDGIRMVIGKLKNPPDGQVGSMVGQSVRFKKEAGWTLEKAKTLADDHPEISKAAAEPVSPLTAHYLELESLSVQTDIDLFNLKIGV